MKHARILVIEDDADIADMLKIFFSSQGSSVEVAATGQQALQAVQANHPDLILLDILLPDMDGYVICQKLRSNPRQRHIPILFLTQKNSRNDILSGLEIGADDYLTKPFDLEELKLRVRNALRRSRTYRQIDARTSLPTGDLLHSTLSRLLRRDGWAILLVRIQDFEALRKSLGLLQVDDLLGRTATWLEGTLHELDDANPFIGYLRGGDFLLITQSGNAELAREACSRQVQVKGGEVIPTDSHTEEGTKFAFSAFRDKPEVNPLVQLEVGLLFAEDGPFEDVQGLLEALTCSVDDMNKSTI